MSIRRAPWATTTSSPGPGNEPFAVEGRRRDPPAESVEDQQRRSEAEGKAERGVDPVERDERRHQGRRETRERAELLCDAYVARSGGDREADPDRPRGDERREEHLGEQVRTSDELRRHGRICEER